MKFAHRLMMILAVMAVAFGAMAQDMNVDVVGGDEAQLRAFIARYFGATYAGAPETEVYIGQLPVLPVEIAFPSDFALAGSIVRNGPMMGPAGTDGSFVEIYATSSLNATSFVESFVGLLVSAGWEDKTMTQSGGGFAPTNTGYANLCKGTDVSINFDANTLNNVTYVGVRVQNPADAYLCAPTQEPPYVDEAYSLIPGLTQPEGVTVDAMFGSGLSYYYPMGPSSSISASLVSELSASDILAAYNAQLTARGWTQLTSDSTATFGRSTWRFSDADGDPWIGTLLIVAQSEPANANRYDAVIAVQSSSN